MNLSTSDDSSSTGPGEPSPKKGRVGRLLRSLKKKSVLLSLLALAVAGADTWAIFLINGWEKESDDLQGMVDSLGGQIADVQSTIEGAEEEISILDEQFDAASAREADLSEEASSQLELATETRDVVIDLGQCVADRLKIVRGLWEHGSAYVASLATQTEQECAAAQSTLANLSQEIE